MTKGGKLNRREMDAMAGWRQRETNPAEYVNYHNFHVQVLGDEEHGFSVGVFAYFHMTEAGPFKTKWQARLEGEKIVNETRKLLMDKAYKVKFNRGFLFGK